MREFICLVSPQWFLFTERKCNPENILMWFFHLLSWAGLGHWAGAYRRGVGRDVSVGARSRRSASADRTEPGCPLGTVRKHCHPPGFSHVSIGFIRIKDGTLPTNIKWRHCCETSRTSSRTGSTHQNLKWHLLFPRSQCLTRWKLATSIKENAASNCGLKFQMSRLVSNSREERVRPLNLRYSSKYPT